VAAERWASELIAIICGTESMVRVSDEVSRFLGFCTGRIVMSEVGVAAEFDSTK